MVIFDTVYEPVRAIETRQALLFALFNSLTTYFMLGLLTDTASRLSLGCNFCGTCHWLYQINRNRGIFRTDFLPQSKLAEYGDCYSQNGSFFLFVMLCSSRFSEAACG